MQLDPPPQVTACINCITASVRSNEHSQCSFNCIKTISVTYRYGFNTVERTLATEELEAFYLKTQLCILHAILLWVCDYLFVS
jgi:hypothetical protein